MYFLIRSESEQNALDSDVRFDPNQNLNQFSAFMSFSISNPSFSRSSPKNLTVVNRSQRKPMIKCAGVGIRNSLKIFIIQKEMRRIVLMIDS